MLKAQKKYHKTIHQRNIKGPEKILQDNSPKNTEGPEEVLKTIHQQTLKDKRNTIRHITRNTEGPEEIP
ncbi:hypothetical protein F8M41_007877 [Gigaspora margarita]|uniref:Uncharacterized protein n=1 Tax=Gigaspora margarita TaxID=4874 RepID=A0A8H4A469_GIGMA|nr:hypothetical protein F8M41_007877 [Gigaspora margarita]